MSRETRDRGVFAAGARLAVVAALTLAVHGGVLALFDHAGASGAQAWVAKAGRAPVAAPVGIETASLGGAHRAAHVRTLPVVSAPIRQGT